jgi:hypothetical protein
VAQDRSPFELLLRELTLSTNSEEAIRRNIETIRENFRRIKQYLDDIGVDKIKNLTQYINNVVSVDVTAFARSETFDVSFDGQTIFTLSETPLNPDKASALLLNTARLFYGAGYTISGTALTFDPTAAGYILEASNEFGRPDRLVVYYNV